MEGGCSCIGYFLSPLGFWEVTADGDGVTRIQLLAEKDGAGLKDGMKTESSGPASDHVQDCLNWLKAYFLDASKISEVKDPVLNTAAFTNKPFCCKVWKLLQKEVGPGGLYFCADVISKWSSVMGCGLGGVLVWG